MLQRFEESRRRFGGHHDVIDTWLDERRDVLVRYCQLSGISSLVEALPRDRALPKASDIHAFCDVLVDYVSAGHFEIYQRLLDGMTQDDAASREAGRLYPAIAATTDAVLTFDERYGEGDDESRWSRFDTDLSALGEQLATRFELEDELLGSLTSRRQSTVQAEQ